MKMSRFLYTANVLTFDFGRQDDVESYAYKILAEIKNVENKDFEQNKLYPAFTFLTTMNFHLMKVILSKKHKLIQFPAMAHGRKRASDKKPEIHNLEPPKSAEERERIIQLAQIVQPYLREPILKARKLYDDISLNHMSIRQHDTTFGINQTRYGYLITQDTTNKIFHLNWFIIKEDKKKPIFKEMAKAPFPDGKNNSRLLLEGEWRENFTDIIDAPLYEVKVYKELPYKEAIQIISYDLTSEAAYRDIVPFPK